MPVKIIVHPHQKYDVSEVFRDRGNDIAKQENAFVIVDPNEESYIINPRNRPIESIPGSITEELANIILENGHVLVMGGIHGKCPYDTLNSMLIAFILKGRESLIVDFPTDFIYCQVDNVGNIPYLHLGELEEDIVGEWTPHITHEKHEPGRKRTNPLTIPIPNNRFVYESGSYILGTMLWGPEIPLETLFQAYTNLTNLWVSLYTQSLLRRADPQRKLGRIQLQYKTRYEQKINSFTIDLTRKQSPFPN